jgi:hypothetical protein
MNDIKITIDNFEFKLISKSVITEETEYYKVEISSRNLTTHEQIIFYGYISQSGTVWRLCSRLYNPSIEKYDNYIQATILDFRLQSFIFLNYDKLPLYGQPEITCEFDSLREYREHINNRGIILADTLPFIMNETTKKTIFDAYIQTLPVNTDTSTYTSKNFIDKYKNTEFDVYKEMVWKPISDMLKGNEQKYEQYKKENNKYENVPSTYSMRNDKLNSVISFYFDKNWFIDNFFRPELQYYLQNDHDVVDKTNNPIILGTDSIPQVPIMKYNMDFKFGKFNNEFFAIRLKNKHNDNIINVHVGKILLNLHDKPTSESYMTRFNGYYICNIIDENVKITKYGLYETYYTELSFTDDDSGKTNYLDKYITKPLEYYDQIDKIFHSCDEKVIFNSPYYFICNCNLKKFLIKELIEEDNKKDKIKYLKYKQKYINLKNRL